MSPEVHMIHSYGVNVCVIARKDTGTTQTNFYSSPLVRLEDKIMLFIMDILNEINASKAYI